MSEKRSIPASVLTAILHGEEPPGDVGGYNHLDLTWLLREPAFLEAGVRALEPLIAHPALHGVRHLSMSEAAAAEDTLAVVLSWLAPGCLETVYLRPIEAYSSATDGDTFPALAASPAAVNLRAITLEYTYISGLAALAASPLRSLEALHLTGAIQERDFLALAGPAPAFRSLTHLTLTPDNLTPEVAARLAASPDLAGVEVLELPFVQGVGFDWSGEYHTEGFAARFPGALAALQQLPGLKSIRLTMPYETIDWCGAGLATQIAALESLTDACQVTIAEGLFADEVIWVAAATSGSSLEWDLFEDVEVPPAAVWVEALHRRGGARALGVEGPPPSELDADELDELAALLKGSDEVDEEDIFLAELVERWGEPALVALLRQRGVTGDAPTRLRAMLDDGT